MKAPGLLSNLLTFIDLGSHNKIEDTKEEHFEIAITAFDKLADKAMQWIAAR